MADRVHCKECGSWKNDRGRGLCYSCKRRLIVAGTLDDKYPPWNSHGPLKAGKRAPVTPNELAGGHWALVPNSAGLWVWIPSKPEDKG